MHGKFIAALLVIAGRAAAEGPGPAPPASAPDPELLVFLGEMGGEDADFIQYMENREARKSRDSGEKDEPKEDRHE